MERTKQKKAKESFAKSFRLHAEAINVYKRTGLTPNELEKLLEDYRCMYCEKKLKRIEVIMLCKECTE